MARFRLSRRAETDFDAIGSYTQDMWGTEQATRYLTRLDETFIALARTPALGKDRSDLRPKLLSCPCDQHVIFFRRDDHGDVEILRILHGCMDFDQHL
jgi:toxin ParE1/3/4